LLHMPNESCIVFEDSPKGVETAKNAGMKAVVVKTYHEMHEFEHFDNIIMAIENYNDPVLNELFK
ncbi:hypothetical protein ACSTLF_00050, partial [Vibrio parahaemolyticus]